MTDAPDDDLTEEELSALRKQVRAAFGSTEELAAFIEVLCPSETPFYPRLPAARSRDDEWTTDPLQRG